jgi:thioredoxin-like negative regulator of GroEL
MSFMIQRLAPMALLTAAALGLSGCNDVVYRADDQVSGSNFTNDGADVARLQRAVAAGDEAARYDLAEYYISNGRYDEAEELGVLIELDERRERLEENVAKP